MLGICTIVLFTFERKDPGHARKYAQLLAHVSDESRSSLLRYTLGIMYCQNRACSDDGVAAQQNFHKLRLRRGDGVLG
eukprot:6191184-Pleurochrysis_carterae.AAC.2